MVTIDVDRVGPVTRFRPRCTGCPWRGPWVTTRAAWPDLPARPAGAARGIAERAAIWHLRNVVHA